MSDQNKEKSPEEQQAIFDKYIPIFFLMLGLSFFCGYPFVRMKHGDVNNPIQEFYIKTFTLNIMLSCVIPMAIVAITSFYYAMYKAYGEIDMSVPHKYDKHMKLRQLIPMFCVHSIIILHEIFIFVYSKAMI